MRKTRYLVIVLVLVALESGCVATSRKLVRGLEYPIERAFEIRAGATEEQVTKSLGQPYARGTDLNGNIILQYEYLVTEGRAFGAGIGVVGVTGSERLTGGKSRFVIDPVNYTVKAVDHEINGAEWYDKLRGQRQSKNP
jgi:hypothetical protein